MTRGLDLILRAIDVALDWRKWIVAIIGVLIALIVSLPLILLGTGLSGAGFLDALSPLSRGGSSTAGLFLIFGACMNLLVVLFAYVVIMLMTGALSRMAFGDLSGSFRTSIVEAARFALSNGVSLILSPIILILGAIAIFIVESVLFLPGRIPEVGQLWAACLSMPFTVINLALFVALLFGAALIPAIVAVEATNPVATLYVLVGLVRRASGRLLGYWIMATPLILLVLVVALYLGFAAVGTTAGLAAIGGGVGNSLSGTNPFTTPSFFPPSRAPLFSPIAGLTGLIYAFGFVLIFSLLYAFVAVVLPISVYCAIYLNVRA